ncbi:hypothetical protein F5B20DRAFT_560328 [Whalleya microplaca]|nr:hypothetical protein F5B20DRAFT_560328 [Whalleya microplaca]
MAPGRKKRQTRLTFESVAGPVAGSSSPAKVRYAEGASSSPGRPSPSKQSLRSADRTKATQSRLQDSIVRSSSPPMASFMPKVHGTQQQEEDSSEESAAEVDDAGHDEGDVDDLPRLRDAVNVDAPKVLDSDEDVPGATWSSKRKSKGIRSSQSVSTRLRRTIIDDEDEDDDEPPASSLKRRRRPPVVSLVEEDEDEDDEPIVAPSSVLIRPLSAFVELSDEDVEDQSPAKKRRISHTTNITPGRLRRPTPSSPVKQSVHKGHRSEKQKKIELLRRRRAGEKIEKLTSSESSDEDKRGIYDTDPEEEFEVLRKFDDEEELEEEDAAPLSRSALKGKGKGKEIAKRSSRGFGEKGDDDDDNLDDFVTDDDDAPLGAPDYLDIPLEFTAQAHKPLKEQFPHVVEWLVHNRINPAFERKDPVYANAWRKLDDEVHGLATSKFASAAWKPEFYRALKGRPKMDSYEMGRGDSSMYETCEACGRSGHPATWKIVFQGHPYYKDTLVEVESEDEDEDEEDDGNDHESIDTQGMRLTPTTKEWHVGAVCCSNAETAHSLIHWKHALKEWVEERLEDEGWMSANKLREREKMKAKRRREVANGIVDAWQAASTISALYRDFKRTLENARNKATTGRGLRGRFT